METLVLTDSSLDMTVLDGMESELSKQLESLKKTKSQLLQKISALKRQISDIETQENEAIRELEMERSLLEGEHRTEMAQLQEDQERINTLKQQQHSMLDRATKHREKGRHVEQRAIEREREKLLMLEEKQHAVMQQLRSSTSSLEMSSSPTTPVSLLNPTAGTSELSMLRESLQRELENQRRIFDDLEFQQLEAEARFDEEKERMSNKLLQDQQQLLQKYKAREERLQQIDTQQKGMLGNVKSTLEGLEQDRLKLVDTFKKEKQSAADVHSKIAELSRMLSLPPNTEATEEESAAISSDLELEEKMEGNRHLFIDSNALDPESAEVRGDGGSLGGKEERKKSSTLMEIERNRTLFMEQQGQHMALTLTHIMHDLQTE
ncbi:pleckstrin homology-like domain family B member 2 isoform X1 [Littorina saxatilis]|uniref:pleckstrin homology-like domain family B member 2 isoform X1 n=1 Tax=Littorina saxatilis TaxID=31220 RepID=UPI0038B6A62A